MKDILDIFGYAYILLSFVGTVAVFPILYYKRKFAPVKKYKKNLSLTAIKIYNDESVYFKGFDSFNLKWRINPFGSGFPDIFTTNFYDFYKADIFLMESSVIIFSKHNFLGIKLNWYYLKIKLEEKNFIPQAGIKSFLCLSAKINNNDLELEFKDFQYKKNIVIRIKNIGLDLAKNMKYPSKIKDALSLSIS